MTIVSISRPIALPIRGMAAPLPQSKKNVGMAAFKPHCLPAPAVPGLSTFPKPSFFNIFAII
jgi:hypothetical protein